MDIKNKSNSMIISGLCLTYCLIGCVGGTVLGFLSLGLPGLAIGLAGGLLMSFVIRKACA